MENKIYSITELTAEIKKLIEDHYPFIWVYGEISNLNIPSSGHLYFTLKDDNSRINAIIFKGQLRNIKFKPENGMSVIGFGRLSLYESKGTYQIIFEYIEPKGIGSLHLAFEQLKKKLSNEGIFDEIHKKKIPFLPRVISIITSTTGSVLFDIINVINRRYYNMQIQIIPVKVQGESSEPDIVNAITLLNDYGNSDVAIIARGGGSLEEMQSFNSESVARAIFESKIPIISAIGHETDFTIADFVSDYRASTPSVAAEIVVPIKNELLINIKKLSSLLIKNYFRYIRDYRLIINNHLKQLKDPKRKIQDLSIRNDDLYYRLSRAFIILIKQQKSYIYFRYDKLLSYNQVKSISEKKDYINMITLRIYKSFNTVTGIKRYILNEYSSKLSALNPVAILQRGYSITRTIPDKHIITDSKNVSIDQNLEVIVSKGLIICRVERI
ncbi:MAG: exodeoxyribonuclease VII large subunit [Desulfobacterales bacterium]